MSDLNEARRREHIGHLKMIPLIPVYALIMLGIYYLLLVDRVEILGIELIGTAKDLWLLNSAFFGGLLLVIIIVSFSNLVFVAKVIRLVGKRVNTGKAMILSMMLMSLSVCLFLFAKNVSSKILSNSESINYWYYVTIGQGFLDFILGGVVVIVFLLTVGFFTSLLIMLLGYHFKRDLFLRERSVNK